MKRLLGFGLGLLALTACDEKKTTPVPAPSASAAAAATPSAAPSASVTTTSDSGAPVVDNAALLALHGKYEAPAKELIKAVGTAVAEEKKKQEEDKK